MSVSGSGPASEALVPAGPHGLGDDRELDLPTAGELERERIERDADDQALRPARPGPRARRT